MKIENHRAVIELLEILDKLTKIRKGKVYLRAAEAQDVKQVEYRVGGQKASHCQNPSALDIHCYQLQEKIDADISTNLYVGLDLAIEHVKEKLEFLGVEL